MKLNYITRKYDDQWSDELNNYINIRISKIYDNLTKISDDTLTDERLAIKELLINKVIFLENLKSCLAKVEKTSIKYEL
jgi:hypothetical protein